VFVRSKLPVEKLSQIWCGVFLLPQSTSVHVSLRRNLSDTQNRGSLDVSDFIVAMYLIQASMSGQLCNAQGKSPAQPEFGYTEVEGEHTGNEIMFLGRQDDNVYLCERYGETFRILRLSPWDAS
jgi:hypothetical protein